MIARQPLDFRLAIHKPSGICIAAQFAIKHCIKHFLINFKYNTANNNAICVGEGNSNG